LFTFRAIIAGRIKIIVIDIGRMVEPKKKEAYWPAPSLGEFSNPFLWSVVPWLVRPLWSHWVVRYQKMDRKGFFFWLLTRYSNTPSTSPVREAK